jgi:hypothetical protein
MTGAAADWDKTQEVQSGKFKVERKSSSLTYITLVDAPGFQPGRFI